MLAWRYDESMAISEQALSLARAVGAQEAAFRALAVIGTDLAYLGRGEEGLAQLRLALRRAQDDGDAAAVLLAYILLTDALTMLGRPAESVRLADTAIDAHAPVRDRHDRARRQPDRDPARNRRMGPGRRAERGRPPRDHRQLRTHAADHPRRSSRPAAATSRTRGRTSTPRVRPALDRDLAMHDGFVAQLALWQRRWIDAEAAVRDGLTRMRSRETAQIRVWLCAEGLRAQAELAALARARRDADGERDRLGRARKLHATARRAAAQASAVTPNATGWRALADAEYERARGAARPDLWAHAAGTWVRLERPPLAAYCRWRQAEALVAVGAPRAEASVPLRQAHAVAARIGAAPLARELELLAGRARLDLTTPEAKPADGPVLGLTSREAEVLTLVARGLTNREIADALVISVKTASVHVSHILRKLDAPNRREAAAIAQRVNPPD